MADVLKKPNGNIVPEDEQPALQQVYNALQAGQVSILIGSDGQAVPIPQIIKDLIRQSVVHLVRGDYVQMSIYPAELTPQQAAEILRVSRQFVVKLINEGILPTNGARRRLQLSDVLAYQRQQAEQTHRAINEIAQLSQESGNYR